MPTNSTPASQPSPEMRVNKAHPERARLCATCEHEGAPDNVHPCNCCWNPLGDMYRRRVVPIAPAEQHSPNSETGRRVFDDPHGRVAARYPVQPSPARSDMPQECEDCGRSMTRCACCPARSDKDAERAAFEAWALAERVAYKDEQYGLCFYDSGSGAHQWIGWQARAAKAQESAPSSESCAECGLDCAPGNCIYFPAPRGGDLATAIESLRPYAGTLHIADRDSYVVGFAKAVEQAAALARRATAGPSSEVSFDAFWSDEVARNGGHGFGADYKHWARKGFDAARRATAGTTAAPSSDALEAGVARMIVGVDGLDSLTTYGSSHGTLISLADAKCVVASAARHAAAGNAAPTEAPAKQLRHRITSWSGKEITSADLVVSLNTYGKCMPGAGRAQWAMREAAAYIAAGNTATAAPGDLPREWVQKTWFDCNQDVFAFTREILASNAGAAPGWQTVPKEPTEAMVHAAEDLPAPRMFAKVYRAMLAAAPSNPPVGAHERKEP